ncbi:hypothetical protein GCM10009811_29710 [Nostocoides veronense]|uniref:Uncharacterized protein n=1 Tax=Nostocoides veronense TaxID=330836 RepID=A0ABN2LZ72_9MICO
MSGNERLADSRRPNQGDPATFVQAGAHVREDLAPSQASRQHEIQASRPRTGAFGGNNMLRE